jgi:hypothetical protein
MGEKPFIDPFLRRPLVFLTILLFIFLPPMIGSGITTVADSILADKHQAKGLECAACHKEEPPEKGSPNELCMTCHGNQQQIAEKTNRIIPNPHASPHLDRGAPLACNECHHIHKPSKVSCNACHLFFKFRAI